MILIDKKGGVMTQIIIEYDKYSQKIERIKCHKRIWKERGKKDIKREYKGAQGKGGKEERKGGGK